MLAAGVLYISSSLRCTKAATCSVMEPKALTTETVMGAWQTKLSARMMCVDMVPDAETGRQHGEGSLRPAYAHPRGRGP